MDKGHRGIGPVPLPLAQTGYAGTRSVVTAVRLPPLRRVCAAVLVASTGAAPVGAQSVPPASAPASAAQETSTTGGPAALGRIRSALEQAPQTVLTLPETPEFVVVIEGKLPRFEDFVTPGELASYAMPGAMTHAEYLAMVTPPEARLYGSSVNGDLVQVIATSVGTSLALAAIAQALKHAFRSRKEEEAKREVEGVLEELRRREAVPVPTAPPPPDPPR